MFTNFSLQNENDTDKVYVYDGEKATGEVLGVFYGGHPPPSEGIFSSTYQIFVIFKSDKTSSHTGFRASYYAIDKFGKFCYLLEFSSCLKYPLLLCLHNQLSGEKTYVTHNRALWLF